MNWPNAGLVIYVKHVTIKLNNTLSMFLRRILQVHLEKILFCHNVEHLKRDISTSKQKFLTAKASN